MAGLINELIYVLTTQAENYEELLILSKEKSNVIINNDLEALQQITAAENAIVGRNQKLEHKRTALVKDIASVLNADENQLTITALANLIKDQEEYADLIKARDCLKETLDELKTVNEKNKKLIEGSLDYIEFTMNVIRSGLNPQASYAHSEGEGAGGGQGFFDAKQ